jgi:hypothetical protein
LNVVKSFEVLSHRLNRYDRVEKATIAVRRQFNLTWRMHHDFALEVQSWQHSLRKEYKHAFLCAEKVIVPEEFHCFLMIFQRCLH